MVNIILKSGKDDAVRRFHPWVFSGAIKKMDGNPIDGSMATIYSNKGEYLATGIYQDGVIAVRIMAFAPDRPEKFDGDFWQQALLKAWYLRESLGLINNQGTNVYRLVHGEGDHLPGLIIDHYNGHLVIQIHSIGLYGYIGQIAECLKDLYKGKMVSIYDKSRETLPASFWKDKDPGGVLFGQPSEVEVLENGNRFKIDIVEGQKTGFFIDQRDNRDLLGKYSHGRYVLNTFCYSGGFSVYALKAGARMVHSLDSSVKAMALTEKNVELNDRSKHHECITGDTMQYLRSTEESYDLIVLDPPAYAKHQHVKHNAVQGYKRLNLEALKSIAPGGLLFTFSCSQVVDMNLFRSTVMSASIQAGRRVRIIHQLTQPADHPVNIFHPEGQYLKGLVLHVS